MFRMLFKGQIPKSVANLVSALSNLNCYQFSRHGSRILMLTKFIQNSSIMSIKASDLQKFDEGDDEKKFSDLFELKEILGNGSFGTVVGALQKGPNKEVAVKIIKKSNFKKSTSEGLIKEAQILSQLNHPNIIKFQKIVETETRIFLIMEWIKGGQLKDLIEERIKQKKPFSDEEAATLMSGLFSAVEYIHSKDIIHRDIKTGTLVSFSAIFQENILLVDKNDLKSIKLVDFGLSAQYDLSNSTVSFSEKCGTRIYMAPELWHRKRYSKPVDLWSCAMIMYMLITTGKHPLYSNGDTQDDFAKRLDELKWEFPSSFNQHSQHLFLKLVCLDPHDRYTAAQVKNHPWITRNFEEHLPMTGPEKMKAFSQSQSIVRIIKIMYILHGHIQEGEIPESSYLKQVLRISEFEFKILSQGSGGPKVTEQPVSTTDTLKNLIDSLHPSTDSDGSLSSPYTQTYSHEGEKPNFRLRNSTVSWTHLKYAKEYNKNHLSHDRAIRKNSETLPRTSTFSYKRAEENKGQDDEKDEKQGDSMSPDHNGDGSRSSIDSVGSKSKSYRPMKSMDSFSLRKLLQSTDDNQNENSYESPPKSPVKPETELNTIEEVNEYKKTTNDNEENRASESREVMSSRITSKKTIVLKDVNGANCDSSEAARVIINKRSTSVSPEKKKSQKPPEPKGAHIRNRSITMKSTSMDSSRVMIESARDNSKDAKSSSPVGHLRRGSTVITPGTNSIIVIKPVKSNITHIRRDSGSSRGSDEANYKSQSLSNSPLKGSKFNYNRVFS